MRYYISVGDRVHEVELGPDGIRWDGQEHRVELATVPGTHLRHLRIGDRGYRLSARRLDGLWHVETGGQLYRLRVEDERSKAIRELTGTTDDAHGASELRAPMPGLVVRVEVERGQVVQAGTALVVIEAMKMQNELKAPADGTVSSIEVTEGETVDRDALLVVLDRGGSE
jgi:biotin carboxyl carrier protein